MDGFSEGHEVSATGLVGKGAHPSPLMGRQSKKISFSTLSKLQKFSVRITPEA